MKDKPSTQNTENYLNETVTCIHCRIGTAHQTKEGLYYCTFCGRTQQRGFRHYTILQRR